MAVRLLFAAGRYGDDLGCVALTSKDPNECAKVVGASRLTHVTFIRLSMLSLASHLIWHPC